MNSNKEQGKYFKQGNPFHYSSSQIAVNMQDEGYQNNYNINENEINGMRFNNPIQQQYPLIIDNRMSNDTNNNSSYSVKRGVAPQYQIYHYGQENDHNTVKREGIEQPQMMSEQIQYNQEVDLHRIQSQPRMEDTQQQSQMKGVSQQQNKQQQQQQYIEMQDEIQNDEIMKQGNDFQQIQYMIGVEGLELFDHQYTMYNQLQNHQFNQNYCINNNEYKPSQINIEQYPQIGNANYQSAKFYSKQSHLNTQQDTICTDKINNYNNNVKQQPNNQDEEDPYFNSIFIFQNRFDVPKRYSLLLPIGIGGYGVVAKAFDQEKQDFVAIKKIFKPFLNQLETKRIIREIKILKALEHDNIISIRDVLSPVPKEKLEDIYIISQLMDTDLHQIIASDQVLSEDHIQFFMYQLLCGLKYIHSAGVFHRDLKPGNLLVNSDCVLKICDFGLARTVDTKINVLVLMTEYVATRWYRAPELLLSWNKYTTAIDMWAVGCIFSELYTRKPLLPGESYLNQLILTLNLTGTPSNDDLGNIQSDRAKSFIQSLGNKLPKDISKLIPNASPQAIDLINKMIVFNPDKRITAEDALKHPFFESIREQDFEVEAKFKFNFDFERDDIKLEELKDVIYEEMIKFHPQFDEKNTETYKIPMKRDSDLFTLDYDGSKIYIDYKHRGDDSSQQVVQNMQQMSEKVETGIKGVNENGINLYEQQQTIELSFYNNEIISQSSFEQINNQINSQYLQKMEQQSYNLPASQEKQFIDPFYQQQQQQMFAQQQPVFRSENNQLNQYFNNDIEVQYQQQYLISQHYKDPFLNQIYMQQNSQLQQNQGQMIEE